MKLDLIRIQDRSRFVKPIQLIHPSSPKYLPYWRDQKKKAVEGMWVEDFGQWRFIPPKLWFCVNHGSILLTDKKYKTRYTSRPFLNDLFWEMGLMSFESQGFSGYSNSKYTSNKQIFELKKNWSSINSVEHIDMFNSDGTFKEYIAPRENIRMLHTEPQGIPLYDNTLKNYVILGSRSGGKSFILANAEMLHEIVTDGAKIYNEQTIKNPSKVTILCGSGQASKSQDIMIKLRDAMTQLGEDPTLGVYGKFGESDYAPSPFYKEMIGSIDPNNADNIWRHEYKIRENGRETIRGTGSGVKHVVYSEMQGGKKGGQAGAGTRNNIVIYEEAGLTPLLLSAWRSNEATIQTNGLIFGRNIAIGTSENIEAVQPIKEIFTDPKSYRLIDFEDAYEHTGRIGFFLPSYLTFDDCKDSNGNTDLEKAQAIINQRRKEKAESNNPDILRSEKLNYPILPSEMWLGTKAKLLPYEETAAREKTLLTNKLYQKIGKPVKLRWDSKFQNGVTYEIDYDSKPIWEYPITNLTDVTGAVVIYDFPQIIDGIVPEDMYIYTHDPYIAEALDEGGSLGVTQVWLNPRYWSEYMITSPLVASYMGKHKDGKSKYYEEQEKLLAMYGDCPQMFYFEADRGEDCINHYSKKKKLHLLAPRPQNHDSMTQQNIRKFGFVVGGRLDKLNKLSSLHDLLLQEIDDGQKKVRFVETIPDIHLIREIMAYDIEGNFDAVSSTLGLVVAIEQLEKFAINDLQGKNIKREKNKLSFLSQNPMIFKPYDDQGYREQHRQNSFWNK